jgi:flagellar biosynthesis protein FlhB
MAEGSEQDDSQKTEDPSQKRLEDARKKGQIPYSREVLNFAMLLALCFFIMAALPTLLERIKTILFPFIHKPEDFSVNAGGLRLTIWYLLGNVGLVMLVPFALTVVAALVAGGAQTRFNMSSDRITPKWEKISPMKGLKRLFSMRNLVEFVKGCLKITLVGMIAYFAVESSLATLRVLPAYSSEKMLAFTLALAGRIVVGVTIALFLIAMFDYFYQRFEFLKNLRMTKQEVKDEYKQQEGDPTIKAKIRQIRSERARKRMMANVPKADVIITNPTHYAIALAYDSASMKAPMVLAKGKDKVALRIKEMGENHRIPIFRNPPVARALFDTAEIDAEIPLEHYAAVAKIIGYVYKMKGKMPKRQ